jgi:mono/diheme cytochrome c family protein
LNDVAAQSQKGQRDRRYYAVPVREDKLAHFATTPLAYMNAPESVESPEGAVPRLSWERLAAFLKRPSNLSPKEGSRAPRMMAYPSLQPKALKAVASLLGVRQPAREKAPAKLTEEERHQADALWTTRCFTCHGGPRPVSGRSGVALGLYSAEWLQAYAGGQVLSPRGARTMPVVPLSAEEARLLYRLFGEMRAEAERELDARISQLKLKDMAVPTALPPALLSYLWGPFFRDATCVHCHATSPRAASAFTADAEGLKAYLRRKSGEEFWRRLETRALEAEHGLVAAKPGMPMAGVELPMELRRIIARWVLEGCKDPEGQSWCRH